ARMRRAGADDVWSALDACDRRDAARPSAAAREARAAIAIDRATLYWLVTRGVMRLVAGERLLAAAADALATLYGTPASDRELANDGGRPKPSSARRPQN